MTFPPHKPELLAPAGNFAMLNAAINAGADSVYFGLEHLNMRSKSSINFSLEDLKEITAICRENNTKTYLYLSAISAGFAALSSYLGLLFLLLLPTILRKKNLTLPSF